MIKINLFEILHKITKDFIFTHDKNSDYSINIMSNEHLLKILISNIMRILSENNRNSEIQINYNYIKEDLVLTFKLEKSLTYNTPEIFLETIDIFQYNNKIISDYIKIKYIKEFNQNNYTITLLFPDYLIIKECDWEIKIFEAPDDINIKSPRNQTKTLTQTIRGLRINNKEFITSKENSIKSSNQLAPLNNDKKITIRSLVNSNSITSEFNISQILDQDRINDIYEFDKLIKSSPRYKIKECSCFNILIVDDEPLILEYMERILRKNGINKLTKANNGLDAVNKVKSLFSSECLCEFRTLLILMDINMPIMNGITAGKEINKIISDNNFDNCELYFISANLDSHYYDYLNDINIYKGYYTKPISKKILLSIINKV